MSERAEILKQEFSPVHVSKIIFVLYVPFCGNSFFVLFRGLVYCGWSQKGE